MQCEGETERWEGGGRGLIAVGGLLIALLYSYIMLHPATRTRT